MSRPPGTGSRRKWVVRLAWYATPVGLAGLAGLLYLGGGAEEAARQVGSVQIAGSETMRPVVTACAEEFMTRNPQSDIIVKGGGSGDGIAALLHGIAVRAEPQRGVFGTLASVEKPRSLRPAEPGVSPSSRR